MNVPTRWVATDRELQSLIAEAGAHEEYALDTEFLRERTYYPQLAPLGQLFDALGLHA